MLELPDVTLCCIDAKNHAMALRAMECSRRQVHFARTVFLSDAIPADVRIPSDIEVIQVGPITSHKEYSRIVLKELYPYIATSHALLIQWDGYVVNATLWDERFMQFDYIGAPWPDGSVGNGGFSLRSRRLLGVLREDCFPLLSEAEDVTICGIHRRRLTEDFQIVFADTATARRFSFEMEVGHVIAGARTFGFHGLFNLLLVMSPDELMELLWALPDSIVVSEMAHLLLNNLLTLHWTGVATALSTRMLRLNPEDQHAANALEQARDRLRIATPRR